MLRRRGIPSTPCFGGNKAECGLFAHTALLVGDTIALGGEIAPEFRPLADLRSNS